MGLKICLIGNISGNIDEGMKKITCCLFNELSRSHDVIIHKPQDILFKKKELLDFNPDIVHYITGPSTFSFIMLRYAKIGLKKTKTVVSISHPDHLFFSRIISILKPDLTLVQSPDMNLFFNKLGLKTEFFPNGVDINKYKPFSNEGKHHVRSKYGIDLEKFVVLHVGNIRSGRNLIFLKRLAKNSDLQVVICSSTTIPEEMSLKKELISSGIKVIDYYVEKIEEVYNLADCYVFTVARRPYAVEVPLSVLEAMSCNLPIVSTKYAGLPTFFSDDGGLFYVDDTDEMVNKVYTIKKKLTNNVFSIKTRDKTIPFSWDKVSGKLEDIYFKLLDEKRNNK